MQRHRIRDADIRKHCRHIRQKGEIKMWKARITNISDKAERIELFNDDIFALLDMISDVITPDRLRQVDIYKEEAV